MSESIGMMLINQRCEDIIRALGIHEITVVDLRRLQSRFLQISILCDNAIRNVQKDLKEGGDGGL